MSGKQIYGFMPCGKADRPAEMMVGETAYDYEGRTLGWVVSPDAVQGRGECEFELNTDMSAIRCSSCGYKLPKGTDLGDTRFCGGCGKAVKR